MILLPTGTLSDVTKRIVETRGSQRDVVYLGWLTAPIWGWGVSLNQWVQLCTWSQNKLWRSNSVTPYLTYGRDQDKKLVLRESFPNYHYMCVRESMKKMRVGRNVEGWYVMYLWQLTVYSLYTTDYISHTNLRKMKYKYDISTEEGRGLCEC